MADETMTNDELRDRAAALDISGRSSMNKAELIDAINASETEGATPPPDATVDEVDETIGATDDRDRTPGIDEAMVEARDAERERLAAQDAEVEDRSGPVALPDELAEIREQTRQADATIRSTREAPETS